MPWAKRALCAGLVVLAALVQGCWGGDDEAEPARQKLIDLITSYERFDHGIYGQLGFASVRFTADTCSYITVSAVVFGDALLVGRAGPYTISDRPTGNGAFRLDVRFIVKRAEYASGRLGPTDVFIDEDASFHIRKVGDYYIELDGVRFGRASF